MILSDEEKKRIYEDVVWTYSDGVSFSDVLEFSEKFEAALLAKLRAMDMPDPESFEAWNAKQHGDPEEIGFLQALRIAYCCGQDSAKAQQAHAQGYAKGAAEQLSAEPECWMQNTSAGLYVDHNKSEYHTVPLYTRKESK